MSVVDEWQLEMDRMLGIFEHESESSLRKISSRFEVLSQPFNDEFRQYFLKMSSQRLDMSFTKIEIERWGKSPVTGSQTMLYTERDLQSGSEVISICSTKKNSNARLCEDDDIHFVGQSENIVEIIDSDDDDYEGKRENGEQDEGEDKASVTVNQIDDDDENIPIIGHVVEIPTSFESDESSNDLVDVEGEFVPNVPMKDELNVLPKTETMNEAEDITLVTFDPNLENDKSGVKDGSLKRQSNSLPMVAKQSKCFGGKRFECEHCDSSFDFKSLLERHQRLHAKGKLIGQKADSNGLYHCTLCIRRFTNMGNLGQHMKSHKGNQYLYYCARCMCEFTQEEGKDRHESQCGGWYYECHLCKVFVTKDKLKMQHHMRTHSGTKPFQCMVCNKSFNTKGSLKRHLNSVHNRIKS